jgi:hypothetical protein
MTADSLTRPLLLQPLSRETERRSANETGPQFNPHTQALRFDRDETAIGSGGPRRESLRRAGRASNR